MNRWMQIAYREALEGMNANDGGPFGAVIVRDGEILARTHNLVLKSKDPTAHAEVLAIREASRKLDRYDLSDCVLYSSCEPCPMCLGAIFWARIKTVYYGASKEDAASGGFDDARFYEMLEGKKRDVTLKQIDREKNAELFRLWREKPDAVIY